MHGCLQDDEEPRITGCVKDRDEDVGELGAGGGGGEGGQGEGIGVGHGLCPGREGARDKGEGRYG